MSAVARAVGLGWRPSPPKAAHEAPDHELDGPLATIQLATTAPASHDASRLVVDVLDQGQLGSCTLNATGQAVRASHVLQLLKAGIPLATILATPPELLSRLFGYYLARAFWHEQGIDSGTFLRTVFEMINRFGFCPERVWPYKIDDIALPDGSPNPRATFTQMPATRAFMAAFDQRAVAGDATVRYVRIASTGTQRAEDIKRAIASDYLVVFGTPVTEAFCRGEFDANKPIPKPGAGDAIAGGHAQCWAKYDENGPWVVGSWGGSFAKGGWYQYSWEYACWSQTDDLWIVEAAPIFSGTKAAA